MAAAYDRCAIFFAFAILLFVVAKPRAEATFINLLNTTVTGRVCCSSTGNCLFFSPPLNNVTVLLNCTTLSGTTVTVGQGTTTANGNFNINVGGLTNITALIPCTVSVTLPLNATICPQLSTITGRIQAIAIPITTTILNFGFGTIGVAQTAVAGLFTLSNGLFP